MRPIFAFFSAPSQYPRLFWRGTESTFASQQRSIGQQAWKHRHVNDHYVKKAVLDNNRTRSAYKLLETNEKFGFIRPGQSILDCGAAPGGWSLAASRLVMQNPASVLISVDLLRFDSIPGTIQISPANILNPKTLEQISSALNGRKLDVILSDMAPNMSGQAFSDHANSLRLCMAVVKIADDLLKQDGSVFMKLLPGDGLVDFRKCLGSKFSCCRVIKPNSSRKESKEIYLLCTGFLKKS